MLELQIDFHWQPFVCFLHLGRESAAVAPAGDVTSCVWWEHNPRSVAWIFEQMSQLAPVRRHLAGSQPWCQETKNQWWADWGEGEWRPDGVCKLKWLRKIIHFTIEQLISSMQDYKKKNKKIRINWCQLIDLSPSCIISHVPDHWHFIGTKHCILRNHVIFINFGELTIDKQPSRGQAIYIITIYKQYTHVWLQICYYDPCRIPNIKDNLSQNSFHDLVFEKINT